jgi:hypothetical protein
MSSCHRRQTASLGRWCAQSEFPTAPRARVRGLRHARGTVENSCVIAITEYLYIGATDAYRRR